VLVWKWVSTTRPMIARKLSQKSYSVSHQPFLNCWLRLWISTYPSTPSAMIILLFAVARDQELSHAAAIGLALYVHNVGNWSPKQIFLALLVKVFKMFDSASLRKLQPLVNNWAVLPLSKQRTALLQTQSVEMIDSTALTIITRTFSYWVTQTRFLSASFAVDIGS